MRKHMYGLIGLILIIGVLCAGYQVYDNILNVSIPEIDQEMLRDDLIEINGIGDKTVDKIKNTVANHLQLQKEKYNKMELLNRKQIVFMLLFINAICIAVGVIFTRISVISSEEVIKDDIDDKTSVLVSQNDTNQVLLTHGFENNETTLDKLNDKHTVMEGKIDNIKQKLEDESSPLSVKPVR